MRKKLDFFLMRVIIKKIKKKVNTELFIIKNKVTRILE